MASAYKRASKALLRDLEEDGFEMSDEDSETMDYDKGDHDGSTDTNSASESEEASKILSEPVMKVRNRVLMLTSRGVSHRHRHLLADLHSLLAHTLKDTKLDTKSSNNYNSALNALADLNSCNYIFFLEARKHGQDLYLWLAHAPNGPTIKLHVSNIHTMGELGFGGNCLKGGRGLVVFDQSFEDGLAGNEHKTLIREMLRGVFCVPSTPVRGMKPFIDRIIGVFGLDGKIWVRIYEIRESEPEKTGTNRKSGPEVKLVEVGPRLVLNPIVILEGSFGGPVIFENKQFVSPNQLRSETRLKKASKYAQRQGGVKDRGIKRKTLGLEPGMRAPDALDNSKLFT